MVEIDSELFDLVTEAHYNKQQFDLLKRDKLDQKWRKLEQKIKHTKKY